MYKFYVILFNFIIFINYGNSFNLSPIPNFKLTEPNLRFHINKTESSYFGYTINFRKTSIIIGAPRAQSTLDSQRKINEPGAIYKCDLNTQTCAVFTFDTEGDVEDSLSTEYYGSLKKEKQWLGAAMDGHSSDSDRLVVCAPNIITTVRPDHYLFNGVCYLTTNTQSSKAVDLKIFAPLRAKRKQNLLISKNQNLQLWMFGQLGFSVHITDDSEEIIIGAPGIFMWKGSIARYRAKQAIELPGLSRRDLDTIRKQRLRREIDFEGEIANPAYWNQKDDSYFGYAITSANFGDENSQLPKTLYVASAPQGNLQTGEVTIFDVQEHPKNVMDTSERTLVIYRKFFGHQMGEYFGYALMVDDFNGDGLTDLVISAPFNGKSSVTYDNGKVYVYLNRGFLIFTEPLELTSDYELNGRFGMTLGKIGDINRDGYADIAIGAPFEGNGVVYIHIGGPNGLSLKPSQRIVAPINEYTTVPHYFGHGISRGVDYDRNGFNDLAIGAPNIDSVYVYKAYPVAKIIASITPRSPSININETKSQISVCLRFDSAEPINFNFELDITIKLDPQLNRAKFSSNGKNEFLGNFGVTSQDHCTDSEITLQYTLGDVFKPIILELHYEIVKKFENEATYCNDCVAINPFDPHFVKNKISFSTGCKAARCVADLSIKSKVVGTSLPYILGSSKSISIEYTIENYGETAYSVELRVTLISRSASFNRIPSYCRLEDSILICNPARGRPLLNTKENSNEKPITFTLSVDSTKLDGKDLVVNTTVSSSGDEENQDDNVALDFIPLEEFSDIEVIGKSSDKELSVEAAGLVVKNIQNTYEIRNLGPSNLKALKFMISIPITYVKQTASTQLSLIKFKDISVKGMYDNTEIQPKWTQNYGDLLDEKKLNKPIIVENLQGIEYDSTQGDKILGFKNDRDNLIDPERIDNHERERRNIYSYNQYTQQAVVEHNISRRSISNEYDRRYTNLPNNRLIYFNCSSVDGSDNFCVHATFEIRNFKAGDKLAQFIINFAIDLSEVDKLYSEDRDIFVMLTKSKVEKPGDTSGSSFKAVILDPYTIITKFIIIETPIWIIVLSVIVGILVLAGLSYGLYKAGFFRRTKKEEMAKLVRQSQLNNPNNDETDDSD